MKTKLNQAEVLTRLRDPRYNVRPVCEHAGVSYTKVIDQMRGRVKSPMPESDLEKLWASMDVLAG